MLELQHIHISYSKKIIFNSTSFVAKHGVLTVIKGKSGTGKSTLIDTLLFKHPCLYLYNHYDLFSLNEEQKSEFIFNKMSYVYQSPLFIDNLSIYEHISLIKDLYQINVINKSLIDKLKIRSLFKKYPKQLSGGEKTRVALFLALLKKPEILILDEPTASLDKDNKTLVIKLLKEYAIKYQAIVIVTTHDQELYKNADDLFYIENQQLNKIKTSETSHISCTRQKLRKNIQCLSKYNQLIRKHNKLSQKLVRLALACIIGFLVFSYSINNASITQISNTIDNLSSKEMIVYKPLFKSNGYSFQGAEFPITDSELQLIKSIPHIERVEWRFDSDLDNIYLCYGEENMTIDEKWLNINLYKITSYDKNKKIMIKNIDNTSTPFLHTYIDDYNYNSFLKKKWDRDGIYITDELYNEIFPNNVKDPYLEFYLLIPQYNEIGVARMPNQENEEEIIDCNSYAGTYKKVKLPIKGTTKKNYLTHEYETKNQIFISQKYLKNLIDQQSVIKRRTIYYNQEKAKTYFNDLPKNIKADQIIYQEKWIPCAYSIIIDDLSYCDEVIKKLDQKGFMVESQYINSQNILFMKESLKNTMITISTTITILTIILYLFIKFINKHEYANTKKFLYSIGLTIKQCDLFQYNEWLCHFRNSFIISTISFFILRFITERYKLGFIKPKIEIIIILMMLSFIIEFIFPFMLSKVTQND